LLRRGDGALVGLHSSWDDKTAMRHGIPWVAIEEFLKEHLPGGTDEAIAGTRDARPVEPEEGRVVPDRDVEGRDLENRPTKRNPAVSFVDLTASSP
jgi:hypothetical protein